MYRHIKRREGLKTTIEFLHNVIKNQRNATKKSKEDEEEFVHDALRRKL